MKFGLVALSIFFCSQFVKADISAYQEVLNKIDTLEQEQQLKKPTHDCEFKHYFDFNHKDKNFHEYIQVTSSRDQKVVVAEIRGSICKYEDVDQIICSAVQIDKKLTSSHITKTNIIFSARSLLIERAEDESKLLNSNHQITRNQIQCHF